MHINPELNEDLKRSCTGLQGYCIYVEKARKYSENMELQFAIGKDIDECIDEGILPEFFEENRDMIITADAIDGTIERRELFAREEGRRELIECALHKGSTPESIADVIGIPIEEVLMVQRSMK